MGDDPLDMASNTGRSCGTVGMDTGMMDLVWCPTSGKEDIHFTFGARAGMQLQHQDVCRVDSK